jgi:hypothetical protein
MFTKGIAKIAGRKKGTPNRLTSHFREAVLLTYDNIGSHEGFSKWASDNRTEFYRIAARLIPAQMNDCDEGRVTVIVNRSGAVIDQNDYAEIVESDDASPKLQHSSVSPL